MTTASSFRKATVLDIPLLFELYLDGSLSGSFSDQHLTGRGHVRLLAGLFRAIAWPRRFDGFDSASHRERIRFSIFVRDGEDLGFLRSSTCRAADGRFESTILTCAVNVARRRTGIGTDMLRRFLEESADADRVVAYCNKYARGMQTCLKRLRFVRQPHHAPMECYLLDRAVAPVRIVATVGTSRPRQAASLAQAA